MLHLCCNLALVSVAGEAQTGFARARSFRRFIHPPFFSQFLQKSDCPYYRNLASRLVEGDQKKVFFEGRSLTMYSDLMIIGTIHIGIVLPKSAVQGSLDDACDILWIFQYVMLSIEILAGFKLMHAFLLISLCEYNALLIKSRETPGIFCQCGLLLKSKFGRGSKTAIRRIAVKVFGCWFFRQGNDDMAKAESRRKNPTAGNSKRFFALLRPEIGLSNFYIFSPSFSAGTWVIAQFFFHVLSALCHDEDLPGSTAS